LILSFSKIYAQQIDRFSVFECAKVFGDSITFLNDFTVNMTRHKGDEALKGEEWDVYLMKGTLYRFALCCYSENKHVVMKLYGDTLSEDTPYNFVSARSSKPYFDFACKKSAVYKVSLRFESKKEAEKEKELSAIGILGFIRKFKS